MTHKVGILALQGAARPHRRALGALGATAVDVRTPADLEGIDAIVLPGGESTTITMLLDSSGLRDDLRDALAAGLPVLATCAGLILLATEVLDGRTDQRPLQALDVTVRRNAYGRQVDSFEAPLAVDQLAGGPFPAVFIRAPVIEQAGAGVDVLATLEGQPVLVRQRALLAATFHPELGHDLRIHELFLSGV